MVLVYPSRKFTASTLMGKLSLLLSSFEETKRGVAVNAALVNQILVDDGTLMDIPPYCVTMQKDGILIRVEENVEENFLRELTWLIAYWVRMSGLKSKRYF